ncbi:phage tail length tape measure family protein [Rhizobium sp. BE258]|uniref:phage tail length tape measure family protein n=1 Tax=Rhizobium sp. BE258 TaxID=2817722 RepID=UPI0028643E68|nr:phage tail length tape measure family protein [Rhizobium sp. BE258]MDR7147145.1 uncharacterized protein (TIGR02594 family) [Rhizobium sp. BE258]
MADNDNNLVFTVSSDMTAASRGMAKFVGEIGTATNQIAKKYEQAGTKIDSSISGLQSRINGMVGLGAKASKEWTGALADQGKELERLRARYSPLFATINNYKTAVADIKRAHALGAISANEMATAISKERQAALASTAAIKGRNAALAAAPTVKQTPAGARGFETANIAAQFQDIAVSASYGNPLQVALQQGTQLSSVLAQMENPIRGIGAAFMSIISPVSLVTIGAIAAGVAAFQYFTSTGDEADKAADALKNHSDLIRRIKEAWPEAAEGLKDYAAESKRILMQDTKDSIALYKSAVVDASKDAKSPLLSIPASDFGGATETIRQVQAAIGQLDTGIKSGNPNLRAFIEQLIEIENQSGTPENIKELIKEIREAAKAGLDAQAKLDPLTKTVEGIGLAAAATAKNIDLFVKAVDKLADISPTPLADITQAQKAYDEALRAARTEADVRAADDALAAAKKRIADQNPTVTNGDGRTADVPTPSARPNIELEGLPGAEKADKKAETAATKAANAYRDLKKSADDRIAQVQQEIQLLGNFGVEADAARFALDLLQQSEDKGRSLSETQRAEIQKKVELYKQYSETLAKAKLSQDLLFQQRFNSLSKEDQQVITTQRQYGLPEDLNSTEAGSIRRSLRTDELRGDLKDFASDFKSALLNNGGDIGKAFADSIENAILNQVSKIWDKLFDQIINAFLGSGTGQSAASNGGGLGGIIGSMFNGGGAASGTAASKAVVSTAGGAVDLATKLLGQNENANTGSINAFLKQGGVDLNAAQTKWCAAFVNSSLAQVGIGGSGSNVANSFLDWGTKIDPSQIIKGDVLVQSRGLGSTQAGGHVGFATGASRFVGGQQQLEMLSGNLRDGVGKSWVDAMDVQARRATEAASSLGSVAKTAGTATQGLGSLGNGLNNFGQKLSSGFPSAPDGGGIGGWFSRLFGGGLNAYGTSVLGSSAQFAGAWSSGGIGLFADGGHVSGEGGPTSDSIPAMLSNGEFVINAASTRKHRKLLEAINSGSVAHLAKGGIVAPALAPSGGYGRGDVEIKIINNNGSQVKQTKRKTASGQSIEMVIDDVVADKMSMPGSRSRGAVQSQFGLKSGLAKR